MHKIISLGLLALSLFLISNTAFSDVSDCDDVLIEQENAPKGLYGLCVAYWSSDNGRGRARIEELYKHRAEAAGYSTVIPGTGVGVPLLPCPCWDTIDLVEAITDDSGNVKSCGSSVDSSGNKFDFFYVGENSSSSSRKYKFESGVFMPSILYCDFTGPNSAYDFQFSGFNDFTIKDMEACSDQIRAIEEFLEVDCTFPK